MAMVRNKKEYLEQLLKAYPSDKEVNLLLVIIIFLIRVIIPLQLYIIKKLLELDNNFAPAYNMIGLSQSF